MRALNTQPKYVASTTRTDPAIDRIRRENKRDGKHKEAQLVYHDDPPQPPDTIDDDRLRLIFTCCHPALAMQTRVALTLRMVASDIPPRKLTTSRRPAPPPLIWCC